MKHYTKVLHLGDPLLSELFNGQIQIQEKVDGSQFRIYKDAEGMLHYGSHRVDFKEGMADKMFNKAIDNCRTALSNVPNDTMIFAEYLSSIRHNTLKYDRVPKNNLVIFDVLYNNKWFTYDELNGFCIAYGFDCVPLLYHGEGKEVTKEMMDKLIHTQSFLGGTEVEGIVIKNHSKTYPVEYLIGMPVMGKYVREEFKEKNMEVWKEIKMSPEDRIGKALAVESRWLKSINRLKEEGKLTNTPKDLAILIPEIINDIEIEEKENIKEELYKGYIKTLKNMWTRGFPEYYKKKLMESMISEVITSPKIEVKINENKPTDIKC